MPSAQPSALPTGQPTSIPTVHPSGQPTSRPTTQPSRQPSAQPTAQPSRVPTSQPTRQPSCRPTGQPSSQPSNIPSGQPSSQPTSQPTQPTGQPSSQPSRQPTGQPSTVPTRRPNIVLVKVKINFDLVIDSIHCSDIKEDESIGIGIAALFSMKKINDTTSVEKDGLGSTFIDSIDSNNYLAVVTQYKYEMYPDYNIEGSQLDSLPERSVRHRHLSDEPNNCTIPITANIITPDKKPVQWQELTDKLTDRVKKNHANGYFSDVVKAAANGTFETDLFTPHRTIDSVKKTRLLAGNNITNHKGFGKPSVVNKMVVLSIVPKPPLFFNAGGQAPSYSPTGTPTTSSPTTYRYKMIHENLLPDISRDPSNYPLAAFIGIWFIFIVAFSVSDMSITQQLKNKFEKKDLLNKEKMQVNKIKPENIAESDSTNGVVTNTSSTLGHGNHHNEDELAVAKNMSANVKTLETLEEYLDAAIGTNNGVYSAKRPWYTQCFYELSIFHDYINVFNSNKADYTVLHMNAANLSSWNRFIQTLNLLTRNTLAFLIVVILLDQQVPADDRTCALQETKATCRSLKPAIAPDIYLCVWDDKANFCSYIYDSQIMQTMATVTLTALLASFIMAPIAYLFDWITYSQLVDVEEHATFEKAETINVLDTLNGKTKNADHTSKESSSERGASRDMRDKLEVDVILPPIWANGNSLRITLCEYVYRVCWLKKKS